MVTSLADFKICLGSNSNCSSVPVVVKAVDYLDNLEEGTLLGSHELADAIGYSYTYMSRIIIKAREMKDYMDWMPGNKAIRLFGSKKTISKLRQLKEQTHAG